MDQKQTKEGGDGHSPFAYAHFPHRDGSFPLGTAPDLKRVSALVEKFAAAPSLQDKFAIFAQELKQHLVCPEGVSEEAYHALAAHVLVVATSPTVDPSARVVQSAEEQERIRREREAGLVALIDRNGHSYVLCRITQSPLNPFFPEQAAVMTHQGTATPMTEQQRTGGDDAGGSSSEKEKKKTVLITGSAGFIGGYLVQELLQNGYRVIGVDNFSKYGKVEREYDRNPDYELHQGDAKDVELLKRLALRCDYIVACAAMIGGISYFHALAYDLLAENERIIAATFDAAIHAFKADAASGGGRFKKIIVLSSSMVFEQANTFPTPEGEQERCAPPMSTYGFQKLACEYYAKGAWEQYQLPYTIVRPFNCVGVGERRALRRAREGNSDQLEKEEEVASGNIKLAMSHVVPDLIQKLLKGQDPLHILGDGTQVRHYTYGGDLARGIRMCIESPAALNQDFNISTATSTTVLELAELVWKKIHGDAKPFRWVSDEPFRYDVQMRVPDCRKAKEVLGFEATTTLSEILDELIPWIQQQIDLGNM